MPRVPHRPSAATVLSLLALMVALGGTGYAAVNLPAGSVGTKQLRDGAVRNVKLHDGSVSTAKLKDGAVSNAKLADNSVGRAKLKDNGVTTDKVRDGTLLRQDFAAGQLPSSPKVHIVASAAPAHGDTGTLELFCDAGEHVIASGWEWQEKAGDTELLVNRPGVKKLVHIPPAPDRYEAFPPAVGETPDAWAFMGRNYGTEQKEFTGYILCQS